MCVCGGGKYTQQTVCDTFVVSALCNSSSPCLEGVNRSPILAALGPSIEEQSTGKISFARMRQTALQCIGKGKERGCVCKKTLTVHKEDFSVAVLGSVPDRVSC